MKAVIVRVGGLFYLLLLLFLLVQHGTQAWITQTRLLGVRILVPKSIPKLLLSTTLSDMSSPEDEGGPKDEDEEECGSEDECEINWDLMPGFAEDDDDDDDDTKRVEVEGDNNNDSEEEVASSVAHNQEKQADASSTANEIDSTSSSSLLSATLVSPIVEYNDFENDLDDISTMAQQPTSSTPTTKKAPSDEDENDDTTTTSTTTTTTTTTAMNLEHNLVSMEMSWQMAESSQECNVDIPTTCGGEICPHCHGKGYTICRLCRGTKYYKLEGMSDFAPCPVCQDNGTEPCRACHGTGWIAEWTQLTNGSVL